MEKGHLRGAKPFIAVVHISHYSTRNFKSKTI